MSPELGRCASCESGIELKEIPWQARDLLMNLL